MKRKITEEKKEEPEKTILVELNKKEFWVIYDCLNTMLAGHGTGNTSRKEIWDVFEKFYFHFEDLEHMPPTIDRH